MRYRSAGTRCGGVFAREVCDAAATNDEHDAEDAVCKIARTIR